MSRDLWENVMENFAMLSISTAKNMDLTPDEQHDIIVSAAQEIIDTIMTCCAVVSYHPSVN